MNLYQIREAIRTETDEARITELIIERDRLVAEERANFKPLSNGEAYLRNLDALHA